MNAYRDIKGIADRIPRVGMILDYVNLRAQRPLRSCGHIGHGRIAYICAHHVDHVGLLCQPCAERHVKGHPFEFERECDQCTRLVLDGDILAMNVLATSGQLRVRRKSRLVRVKPAITSVTGLGLCVTCAAHAGMDAA